MVDPDVTEVGPVRVMVGTDVLLLWHEVQVEPFLPENPDIPPLLAFARTGARVSAMVIKTIRVIKWFGTPVKVSEKTLWVSGDLRSSTVASFLSPSHYAHEGHGGIKECTIPFALTAMQRSACVPEIEQREKLD